MPKNKPNKNLINEVLKIYHSNRMKEELTVSSTAGCLIVRVNDSPGKSVDIPYRNDDQVVKDLGDLIKTGHIFSVDDVSLAVSIHQNRLQDAKAKLLNEVLRKPNNAYARQNVISDLGMALNLQIDKNPLVHNKRVYDISEKLKLLDLKSDNIKLYKKSNSLNKYYNAVKHSNQPKHIKNAENLKGTDGLEITIDFFETVRRTFRWYYKKYGNGIPDWDELKAIKYSDFNVKYRFRYERLW